MPYRIFGLLLICASSWSCTSTPDAPAPNDAILGVIFSPEPHLYFADDPAISEEIVRDLKELESALQQITSDWKASHPQGSFTKIDASRDGHRFALCSSGFYLHEPTGVWLWPDWRDAERRYSFPEYSKAFWLSNDHVLLEQRVIEEVTPANEVIAHFKRCVVDLRSPDRSFPVGPVKLTAVDQRNTWYGIDEQHNLIQGQLQHAAGEQPTNVFEQGVEEAVLFRDSQILAVRKANRTIVTYSTHDGAQLGKLENAQGIQFPTNEGFITRIGATGSFVKVQADGTFNAHSLPWLGRRGNERPFLISPDGNWTLTWRDTWYGGLKVRLQPLTDERTPKPKLPRIPHFPRGHFKEWLSWS